MGIIKTSFHKFSKEYSLRFDFNYIKTNSFTDSNDYDYRTLFDIVDTEKVEISLLDDFEYAEIGNVQSGGEVFPVNLSFSNRTDENENLFKKIEKGDIFLPKVGDILLAKIRPYLNKNVLVGERKTYFTTAFIQIRPIINPVILYNLIRSLFFEKINAVSRCGKGYPTLNEKDLKTIHFPKQVVDSVVDKSDILINEINSIEQEISVLKSSKIPHIDIINEVFGQEFGFDWKEFERLKRQKIYSLKLINSPESVDCRLGCRFHQPAAKYVMDFMAKQTNKRIKDFCSEPICLGASLSPADYDESGEYKYIAMSSFPNWELNIDDSKTVSNVYAQKNQNKTLQKGDVVLARSGEGTIGKVALVIDENIKAIFADFTQRIRLDNYNKTFAYYYFRSVFFQYLVYKEKKGLGNNTNIFPSQIQELPIPDYSLDKQQEIVYKIEKRINAQKDIDCKIEAKRLEINKLIMEMANLYN